MSTQGQVTRDLRLVRTLFLALGLQVGAFAVLTPSLARTRGLSPGEFGLLMAVGAVSGIATLVLAGRLADRFGSRPLVLAGCGLFATALLGLALFESVAPTVAFLLVNGVASGFLDLGANASGARAEALHGGRRMVGFHAGFSAAAAAGALGVTGLLVAGVAAGPAYGAVAAVYLVAVVGLAVATRGRAVTAPPEGRGRADAPPRCTTAPTTRLWRTPGVVVAVVLCTTCFLGDGMLESFSPLVLRDALGTGVLLAGVGIGGFHVAMLLGRLALAGVPGRTALVVGGCGAAVGVSLVVLAPAPWVGAAGLMIAGFALAPVVPTTLSLAARAAPDRPGEAVSLVVSVGYSAFVAAPPLAGLVAATGGLDVALAPVVVTTLLVAGIAATSAAVRRLT